MIGLGQIVTLGNSSNRIHEMRLFQEVAKVDEKEAELGARHSDAVRLGSRDGRDEDLLGKKTLGTRLSKFWLDLKSRKTQPDPEPKEDCPIAAARAASVTGENAPLGWLTLDHHGNDSQLDSGSLKAEEFKSSQNQVKVSKETNSLSFLQPDPEDSDYLFNEEWFLSPCG